MIERPIHDEIEFFKTVLKISEECASKEFEPGFFAQQADRIRSQLLELELKAKDIECKPSKQKKKRAVKKKSTKSR